MLVALAALAPGLTNTRLEAEPTTNIVQQLDLNQDGFTDFTVQTEFVRVCTLGLGGAYCSESPCEAVAARGR